MLSNKERRKHSREERLTEARRLLGRKISPRSWMIVWVLYFGEYMGTSGQSFGQWLGSEHPGFYRLNGIAPYVFLVLIGIAHKLALNPVIDKAQYDFFDDKSYKRLTAVRYINLAGVAIILIYEISTFIMLGDMWRYLNYEFIDITTAVRGWMVLACSVYYVFNYCRFTKVQRILYDPDYSYYIKDINAESTPAQKKLYGFISSAMGAGLVLCLVVGMLVYTDVFGQAKAKKQAQSYINEMGISGTITELRKDRLDGEKYYYIEIQPEGSNVSYTIKLNSDYQLVYTNLPKTTGIN